MKTVKTLALLFILMIALPCFAHPLSITSDIDSIYVGVLDQVGEDFQQSYKLTIYDGGFAVLELKGKSYEFITREKDMNNMLLTSAIGVLELNNFRPHFTDNQGNCYSITLKAI